MRTIKITTGLFILFISLALNSCEGERGDRVRVHEAPIYGQGAPMAQQSELVPGQGVLRPKFELQITDATLAEGKRLYGWYNCAGCHFNGGGIGPPLMDDDWIYGSEPHNIADSIINGRPQGMPSYGGRIPAAHIAPIVAYVRSLSGLGTGEPTRTPYPSSKKDPKPIEEKQKEQPGVEELKQQKP